MLELCPDGNDFLPLENSGSTSAGAVESVHPSTFLRKFWELHAALVLVVEAGTAQDHGEPGQWHDNRVFVRAGLHDLSSVAGHMESHISGYLGRCYARHNGGSIAVAM